jgi:hypothetical protein
VARWGYSTSVAIWEYFNEINPNLPAGKFYTKLGEYLEQIDPYNHLSLFSTPMKILFEFYVFQVDYRVR